MSADLESTVLVVGYTGYGKSSLCCWLANTLSTDIFRVSDQPSAGSTKVTEQKGVRFLGGECHPDFHNLRMKLVDVPGLGLAADGQNDDDILFRMKDHVERECPEGIKAVIWVDGSANPRLDEAKAAMMRNYMQWLGTTALDNLIIVFNKVSWLSQDGVENDASKTRADTQFQRMATTFKTSMKQIVNGISDFHFDSAKAQSIEEKIDMLPCVDLNLMPVEMLEQEQVSSPADFIQRLELFQSGNFKSLIKLASRIKTRTVLAVNRLELQIGTNARLMLMAFGKAERARNMYLKANLAFSEFNAAVEKEVQLSREHYQIQCRDDKGEFMVANDHSLHRVISHFIGIQESGRIITVVDVQSAEVQKIIDSLRKFEKNGSIENVEEMRALAAKAIEIKRVQQRDPEAIPAIRAKIAHLQQKQKEDAALQKMMAELRHFAQHGSPAERTEMRAAAREAERMGKVDRKAIAAVIARIEYLDKKENEEEERRKQILHLQKMEEQRREEQKRWWEEQEQRRLRLRKEQEEQQRQEQDEHRRLPRIVVEKLQLCLGDDVDSKMNRDDRYIMNCWSNVEDLFPKAGKFNMCYHRSDGFDVDGYDYEACKGSFKLYVRRRGAGRMGIRSSGKWGYQNWGMHGCNLTRPDRLYMWCN